jgi:hypothetical protein
MRSAPPTDSSTQDDIAFVIRELSNHVRREEVMQALIMRRGYSWTEAGYVVDQIAARHQGSIAARQLPLYLFLGITTFIAGCVLVTYSGYRLMYYVPINPFVIRNLFIALGSGAVMIGGSLIGLVQAFTALRK